MKRYGICAAMVAMVFSLPLKSAEAVKAISPTPIAEWQNLPGTDGKQHSLSDLADKEVVVVGITCNHCPIALEYFERLRTFDERFGGAKGRVALVTASVSSLETDKLPRMKELAEKESLRFAYFYDESQQIAKKLGATVTPQFFVLDVRRQVVFRGPWDDNVNATKVKKRFVEDAVTALLAGKQPPVAQVKAIGCAIRYEK